MEGFFWFIIPCYFSYLLLSVHNQRLADFLLLVVWRLALAIENKAI